MVFSKTSNTSSQIESVRVKKLARILVINYFLSSSKFSISSDDTTYVDAFFNNRKCEKSNHQKSLTVAIVSWLSMALKSVVM
jgi:hypothetical protein